MHLEIQAVHFDLKDETRDFIEEKLQKIEFARDMIVDIEFTLVRDAREFELEVKIHFRWGKSHVIKLRTFELHEGLEKLIAKLEMKVRKEKEKIKEHKA
ncbi:MAG: HPF/RaiA family ribosome-associated protein [Spirochaetaceae bacterium]|nr:MAG: HPF/RaiA family ribosome-associated protein [Spirochaetaceae bacterium]